MTELREIIEQIALENELKSRCFKDCVTRVKAVVANKLPAAGVEKITRCGGCRWSRIEPGKEIGTCVYPVVAFHLPAASVHREHYCGYGVLDVRAQMEREAETDAK